MTIEVPRRSDGTRAAILAAARARFAADGYERATIRAIAADAAIDPSMVMRYYGNKEKLFAAAAEFDLRMPDLGALPPGEFGAALVRHFLQRWESEDTFMALLRAAVSNDAARERMSGIFATQVAPLALRTSAHAGDAAERAGLVASQMLGLALGRYVLRLPPIVAMTPDDIVAWVGPTVQRYLAGDRPTGPAAG
jgi:AcrR family transcriptional regulator